MSIDRPLGYLFVDMCANVTYFNLTYISVRRLFGWKPVMLKISVLSMTMILFGCIYKMWFNYMIFIRRNVSIELICGLTLNIQKFMNIKGIYFKFVIITYYFIQKALPDVFSEII